jgi:nickel-dependent lactate racemase
MAAAERVVAEGGTIVMAAACVDGLPAGGAFARLLAAAADGRALAGDEGVSEADRWQVQVLGRVLQRADVWLYTDGLDDDEVTAAHLRPVADVSRAVADALAAAGPEATLCVLPQGPMTVVSRLH